MNGKICAIIVSYNIGKDIYRCFDSVIDQVNEMVIVDNASADDTVNILRDIKKKFPNVELIENKENLGIAAALNEGAKYAIEKGHKWALTLDHDSEAENGMVGKMMDAYNNLTDKEKESIGIIAPNYEIIKGLAYKEKYPSIIATAITSGQLVKTDIFKKSGFYKEDLFIECVDHEFCLRVLKRGFKTLLAPGAVLKQRIGLPQLHNIFGKKIVACNHSPERYYYIFRNSIYLYKNYFLVAPIWILNNMVSSIVILLKILFLEENKIKKFKMILKGCADGIRDKYGKLIINQ